MSELRAVKPEPSMSFSAVPAEHVPFIWPEVHDMLLRAVELSNGRWTMREVLHGLVTGNQTLWVAFDQDRKVHAALTTQPIQYPHRTMLSLHFLAGMGFEEWAEEWFEIIERYAKDMNCDGIEAMGRYGFKSFLKERGFDSSSVLYTKTFDED